MAASQASGRQLFRGRLAAAVGIAALLLVVPRPVHAQFDPVMRDLLGRFAAPPGYPPPAPAPRYPPPQYAPPQYYQPQYGSPPSYLPPRPSPYAAPVPLVPAAGAPDGRAVAEAQRLLTELGYDAGPADGAPGARTIAAVRAFQRDHGQAPTGEIGPATLAALRNASQVRSRASAAAEADGPSSAAPDLASAKAFLTQVYAPYIASRRNNAMVQWKRWADPSLVSMLERMYETTPADEVPALNGDLICGCQEWDFSRVAITTRAGVDGEVLGTASFSISGDPRRVQFRLVSTRAGWRIFDIMDADTPSLRKYLQDDFIRQTARRAQIPDRDGVKHCLRDQGIDATFAARVEPSGSLAFALSFWTERGSHFGLRGMATDRADGWRFEQTPQAPNPQERCVMNIARTPDGGYALSTEPGARCEAHGGQGSAPTATLTFAASTRAGPVTNELSAPDALMQMGCDISRR